MSAERPAAFGVQLEGPSPRELPTPRGLHFPVRAPAHSSNPLTLYRTTFRPAPLAGTLDIAQKGTTFFRKGIYPDAPT